MLNSIQRKLLFAGVLVTLISVMFFVCSLQLSMQEKAVTRQAMLQMEGNIILYLAQAETSELSRMQMIPGVYNEIYGIIDENMLHTPITTLSPDSLSVIAPNGMNVENDVTVLGVTEHYAEIANADIISGQFFTADDVRNNRKTCVVSQTLLDYHGIDHASDMNIEINGIPFLIVGIIDFPYSSFAEQNLFQYIPENGQLIITPFTCLSEISTDMSGANIDFIIGRSSALYDDNGLDEFSRKIEETLTQNEEWNMYLSGTNFYAVPESQLYLQERSGETATILGGVIISFLMLFLSGINIIQVVISSIYDNQQKIALKIAMGATIPIIVKELFIELFTINIKAGYVGLAFSGLFILYLNKELFRYTMAFNITSLFAGIAAIIVLTVLSMILPVLHLSRIQPAQAIREVAS